MQITVTDAAQKHFQQLIRNEETPNMNLRIYVENPQTAIAKIGLTFCPEGGEEPQDMTLKLSGFDLYVDPDSTEALVDAKIDYEETEEGGQLNIKAPHLKGTPPGEACTLQEQIEYLLRSDINPSLAGHGGRVRLVELVENDTVVILEFGGGCQGCGMANVTLKRGIERTLKEKFPNIHEVRDVTDHAAGANPYY